MMAPPLLLSSGERNLLESALAHLSGLEWRRVRTLLTGQTPEETARATLEAFTCHVCPHYVAESAHRLIAQTLDRESNLRAQERMLTLATNPRLIVPGHDPAVFLRFATSQSGIARIR